jgi:hypothetical protein
MPDRSIKAHAGAFQPAVGVGGGGKPTFLGEPEPDESLTVLLERAEKLYAQKRDDKNK